ncbi:hypothetical protein FALBO_774 [Fusarium albosuccineum]|uniref:Uncharacterized protein n=1 Tax=Fusarium albosuccineum TaxID=1237068 RepID=A0A8H4LMW5_9HYPO|nr:hypothetical protein FALBO_774 [Fusarium albosuccineum]
MRFTDAHCDDVWVDGHLAMPLPWCPTAHLVPLCAQPAPLQKLTRGSRCPRDNAPHSSLRTIGLHPKGKKDAMRPSTIKHDACAHAVTAPPYPRLDALAQKTGQQQKQDATRKMESSVGRISARRSPA